MNEIKNKNINSYCLVSQGPIYRQYLALSDQN